MNTLDTSQDIIDIGDVHSRIEELESERQTLVYELDSLRETLTELSPEDIEDAQDNVELAETALDEWNYSYCEELATLKGLTDEVCEDASPMIRDSYFEEYAMQLADDLGATRNNDAWPLNCIDWQKAAECLQQDYTSVDFAGEDYWVRRV